MPILHNRNIEVYGDGTQTRDPTYVSDVIQANLLAAESKSKVNREVFNIGGGSRISVKELIKLLESTGSLKIARYWKNCKSNLFGSTKDFESPRFYDYIYDHMSTTPRFRAELDGLNQAEG